MFRTRIEVVLNLPEGRAPVSSSYRTLRDRLVRFCGHTEHTGTVQWGVYRADTSGTLVRTLSCGRCPCGDNGKTALPPQVAQQLAFILLYADELHREHTNRSPLCVAQELILFFLFVCCFTFQF